MCLTIDFDLTKQFKEEMFVGVAPITVYKVMFCDPLTGELWSLKFGPVGPVEFVDGWFISDRESPEIVETREIRQGLHCFKDFDSATIMVEIFNKDNFRMCEFFTKKFNRPIGIWAQIIEFEASSVDFVAAGTNSAIDGINLVFTRLKKLR